MLLQRQGPGRSPRSPGTGARYSGRGVRSWTFPGSWCAPPPYTCGSRASVSSALEWGGPRARHPGVDVEMPGREGGEPPCGGAGRSGLS